MNVSATQFARVKAEKQADKDVRMPPEARQAATSASETLAKAQNWVGGRATSAIEQDAAPYTDVKPPLARRSSSLFVSRGIETDSKRVFQVHGDCRECMSRARDAYDSFHRDHVKDYLALKTYGDKDAPA